MSSIGERIKIRRKEIGMSAKELGEIIGKTESTIFRYEKGRISNVDSNIIVPIAEALRTTPAYLMGWDDESTSRKKVSNIIQFDQLAHHKIPLAGSVAGGEPIYDEEVDLFIEGPTKASYAVRLKGHSMEPLYKEAVTRKDYCAYARSYSPNGANNQNGIGGIPVRRNPGTTKPTTKAGYSTH